MLRTRDQYYSLFTIMVVKIVLFVFLCAIFVSSIRIMRTIFKNVPPAWRYGLPAVIAVAAVVTGVQIYNNVKQITRCRRELEESRRGGAPF